MMARPFVAMWARRKSVASCDLEVWPKMEGPYSGTCCDADDRKVMSTAS